MTTVFEFSAYKPFLQSHLREQKVKRGYQAALAKAAGCQASYLSQVITSKAELTPEHAAGVARFLGMDNIETEFFMSLVQLSRASSPEFKAYLVAKIDQLRAAHGDLLERISGAKKSNKALESFYYSSWYWSAIHVATSSTAYQTVSALAERFSLPISKVNEVLHKLESLRLVSHQSGRWIYESGAAHLPKESSMTELNHSHWRLKALQDVQSEAKESLHYTSVFGMSKGDFQKIRELLIETVAKSRKISEPSASEEVFCFSLDLFRV